MVINDFAILASDTARTKAYIQMMARKDLKPGICVIYTDHIEKMREEAQIYMEAEEEAEYFDLEEPILHTVKKAGIDYRVVTNKDINSDEMALAIQSLEQKYLIYSGYGGAILKKHLFQYNKRFVHVHAGILPQYRGSTTAYYSLLQEGYIGATAIFLNEGIDEGEIIATGRYPVPPNNVDVDLLYEPYLRSLVLEKVMSDFICKGELKSAAQTSENAQTYFIIHPVLKHLALMGKGPIRKG